ncbi:MAG: hypothetical protein ACI8P3_000654 [Saprospiraceae bacterium]|jgi:hypothetical protein
MKIVLYYLVLIISFPINAQIIYFDNQYDYLHRPESPLDICRLDGSYLLGGGEALNGNIVNNSFYFVKIDSAGNLLQQKSIGAGQNKSATIRYIFKKENDSLFVQGTRSIFGQNYDTQIFLAEINNETLDTIWTKDYGNTSLLEGTGKAIKTADGGFAVTGWVFSDNYNTRIYLMKMDSVGNLEYYKHYTPNSNITHEGMSLVQTIDGGFLMLGFRRYWDYYKGDDILIDDKLLLKVDAQGEQEWIQFYPSEPDSLIKSNFHKWIIGLEDGNYLSGGRIVHFKEDFVAATDFREYSLTKYNPEGEVIWDKTYGNNFGMYSDEGIVTSSGNIVFVGYEIDPLFPGSGRRQYGLMASTDSVGELLWLRKYYSAPADVAIDFFHAVTEAPDGGYVACGDSFGPWADSTYQNVWVIKTDSIGCLEPFCDSIFTAVEEPFPLISEAALRIYPNPTTDQLTIDTGEAHTLLGIQIFDSSGKRVEDIQFFRAHHLHSHTLSIAQFPAGMYFVNVRTEKGWWSGKVVKL